MTSKPVLDVSQDEVDNLRERILRTRWAPEWPTAGWIAGSDHAEVRRLATYWADGFDWHAQQNQINELPWHSATISGTPVSYLRFEGETEGALPIVLTNGWPSTALEPVELAKRLATPSAFGGDKRDSFTVIVPALPGFPFSPQRPAHTEQVHEIWHSLMSEELGFSRYAAHDGDLGAGITSRLAEAHPEALVGIHLLAVASPADPQGAHERRRGLSRGCSTLGERRGRLPASATDQTPQPRTGAV